MYKNKFVIYNKNIKEVKRRYFYFEFFKILCKLHTEPLYFLN